MEVMERFLCPRFRREGQRTEVRTVSGVGLQNSQARDRLSEQLVPQRPAAAPPQVVQQPIESLGGDGGRLRSHRLKPDRAAPAVMQRNV